MSLRQRVDRLTPPTPTGGLDAEIELLLAELTEQQRLERATRQWEHASVAELRKEAGALQLEADRLAAMADAREA